MRQPILLALLYLRNVINVSNLCALDINGMFVFIKRSLTYLVSCIFRDYSLQVGPFLQFLLDKIEFCLGMAKLVTIQDHNSCGNFFARVLPVPCNI